MKALMQHTARTRRGWMALALAAALTAAGAGPAAAVTVTAGTGSGMAGQTVDIAITATSTTGLNIQSLQFDLAYNASIVTAVDVLEAGDLTGDAGWGDATFNVTSGKIRVSHAGVTPLTGAGALLHVRFSIIPLNASSTALTLSNIIFNEGNPSATSGPNGSITVTATPTITVSPNTAELIRGQTQQFTVTGGVVNPVTWSTTNPSIAMISGTGLLTGVAPGTVRVHALDSGGHADDSDGDILVRGMGVTAGGGSVYVNNVISVPITVTDLSGLGIRAGQVTLTYSASALTATGVVTTGTMLDGYGTVVFGSKAPGTCTVDFAGTSDLTGSGTLFKIDFTAGPNPSGSSLVPSALFNETLPAKPTNGSISVQALPTITVNPDSWTMYTGDTKTFTLTGSPVPPIAWSVTDPAVASINPSTGLLTALKGGQVQVRAQDNVGAVDYNTLVDIYDFQVSLFTVTVAPGGTVSMPVLADRKVGAFDVRSAQYELRWSSPYVTSAAPTGFGIIPASWSGNIVSNMPNGTSFKLAAAGSSALANTDSVLHRVAFTVSPSTPVGTNIPITLYAFLANEGAPRVRLGANGVLQVRTTVDVPGGGAPDRLSLAEPWPNPGSRMVFDFGVPAGAPGGMHVRLDLIGVDGRRVRTLADGVFAAGRHQASWDGRDDGGHLVPAGIYFARLEGGNARQMRKIVRLQ